VRRVRSSVSGIATRDPSLPEGAVNGFAAEITPSPSALQP
jgi:hypothetical protein